MRIVGMESLLAGARVGRLFVVLGYEDSFDEGENVLGFFAG